MRNLSEMMFFGVRRGGDGRFDDGKVGTWWRFYAILHVVTVPVSAVVIELIEGFASGYRLYFFGA